MKTTIGNFLFLRLRQMGIGHVFGVPGDFNLQLLEQMREGDGPEFIGTCNELNAAYAADGYARMNGVGALLTTYGVGDLSALCGIAGACAEHLPVVCLSGTPPLYAMESRLRLHHSLADGNFDNVRNCLREFTAHTARLTPANAGEEIDRALLACLREKKPVFIQVPSNISYLEIDAPEEPLSPALPASDAERLESAARHIARLLARATQPVLLIDREVDRSGLAQDLTRLAHKRRIPYVALRTGKAMLNEDDPLYAGMFNGRDSVPRVRDLLQRTDCLMAFAPGFSEGSPVPTPKSPPGSARIFIQRHSLTVEGEIYEGVNARDLMERLPDLVERVNGSAEAWAAQARECADPATPAGSATEAATGTAGAVEAASAGTAPEPKALTQARLWSGLAGFFCPGDVIYAETGTALSGLADVRLPEGAKFIAQPIWGAIGHSLPALLGAMTAANDRRHILFIGDGSFQLTAQELSTILRRKLRPIIFLLNNDGYTIERWIFGKDAPYNDIAPWQYTRLPEVFAPGAQVFTATAGTGDELEEALREAGERACACFIELRLDRLDAPEILKIHGPRAAENNYGPRGPQSAHGASAGRP